MLVLSRRKDESVFINGNIRVMIVDVRGEKVRLGFEAPDGVEIWRGEIFEEIQKAKKSKKG